MSNAGYAPVTRSTPNSLDNTKGNYSPENSTNNNNSLNGNNIDHNNINSNSETVSIPLQDASLNPNLSIIPINNIPIKYLYIVLFFSLLAVSTAATLLRELDNTPPFLKSFWRLFNLAIVLCIGFLYQYRKSDSEFRSRYFASSTLSILLISGLSTGFHFATWIWSLNHTTLAHSLFFVCFHPLIIVCIMLLQRVKLNRFEFLGVLLGFIGMIFLLVDLSHPTYITKVRQVGETTITEKVLDEQNSPSITGDLLAFLGAIFMVIYLYAGKTLRCWMPLFLYTAPITLISCLPVLLLSIFFEDITLFGLNDNSLFGFLSSSNIGIIIIIVLWPGIVGHTGINLALAKVSPLAVSILLTLEPILGTIIGLIFHVSLSPGLWTWFGGPISVIGCILAIYGTHLRQQIDRLEVENINSWNQQDDETQNLNLNNRDSIMNIDIDDNNDNKNDTLLFADSEVDEDKATTINSNTNKENKENKDNKQSTPANNSTSNNPPKKSNLKKPNNTNGQTNSTNNNNAKFNSLSSAHFSKPKLSAPQARNAIEMVPRLDPFQLNTNEEYGVNEQDLDLEHSLTSDENHITMGNETEADEGDINYMKKQAKLKQQLAVAEAERMREEHVLLAAEMAEELYKEHKRALSEKKTNSDNNTNHYNEEEDYEAMLAGKTKSIKSPNSNNNTNPNSSSATLSSTKAPPKIKPPPSPSANTNSANSVSTPKPDVAADSADEGTL